MQQLPADVVRNIKGSMVELQILDEKERDDPNIDGDIQAYAVLLFRVIQDAQKIPNGETYRVVEFGCGKHPGMFFFVYVIAHLYRKQILYVGIDVDGEAILQLNWKFLVNFSQSCRYICADGSDMSWRDKAGDSCR